MLKPLETNNQVKVDIVKNKWNELCLMSHTAESKSFDELFPPLHGPIHVPKKSVRAELDIYMYALLFMQDNTVTLLSKQYVMTRIESFKQSIIRDYDNGVIKKLLGRSMPQNFKDIVSSQNRSPSETRVLLSCIGNKHGINIIKDNKIAYIHDMESSMGKCLHILSQSPFVDMIDCDKPTLDMYVKEYLKENLIDINKALVKDLKECAQFLKIKSVSTFTKPQLIEKLSQYTRI